MALEVIVVILKVFLELMYFFEGQSITGHWHQLSLVILCHLTNLLHEILQGISKLSCHGFILARCHQWVDFVCLGRELQFCSLGAEGCGDMAFDVG